MVRKSTYLNGGGNGKRLHEMIAEKALGKALPKGALVHHLNGNPRDNRNENLAIFPNIAYHKLIHRRMLAVAFGYPPYYRRCPFCKQYDNPLNMKEYPNGKKIYHLKCAAKYHKSYMLVHNKK